MRTKKGGGRAPAHQDPSDSKKAGRNFRSRGPMIWGWGSGCGAARVRSGLPCCLPGGRRDDRGDRQRQLADGGSGGGGRQRIPAPGGEINGLGVRAGNGNGGGMAVQAAFLPPGAFVLVWTAEHRGERTHNRPGRCLGGSTRPSKSKDRS